jgi:hypothetical protein
VAREAVLKLFFELDTDLDERIMPIDVQRFRSLYPSVASQISSRTMDQMFTEAKRRR